MAELKKNRTEKFFQTHSCAITTLFVSAQSGCWEFVGGGGKLLPSFVAHLADALPDLPSRTHAPYLHSQTQPHKTMTLQSSKMLSSALNTSICHCGRKSKRGDKANCLSCACVIKKLPCNVKCRCKNCKNPHGVVIEETHKMNPCKCKTGFTLIKTEAMHKWRSRRFLPRSTRLPATYVGVTPHNSSKQDIAQAIISLRESLSSFGIWSVSR